MLLGLGGAGQLQRHQEIGGLPHPGRQAVLHRDHGRPAGAGAQRDMVEAEREGAVDRQRAAEAHAAIHRELARRSSSSRTILRKFLSQRTVMPYSATPPNPAMTRVVEAARTRLATSRIGANGTRSPSGVDAGDLGRQRLDLQPVDRGDEMAVIDQVMRQGEPGRAEPDHQHLVARSPASAAAGAG